MKKIRQTLTAAVLLSAVLTGYAQTAEPGGLRGSHQPKMLSEQEKAQRKAEFLRMRQQQLIEELQIPAAQQQEFLTLYQEYQNSQQQIREKFQTSRSFGDLTDAQARQQLEQSFVLGQQLLDNRRRYAERFGRFLKPQQILKLYQNESRLRSKIMQAKDENRPANSYRGMFKEKQPALPPPSRP